MGVQMGWWEGGGGRSYLCSTVGGTHGGEDHGGGTITEYKLASHSVNSLPTAAEQEAGTQGRTRQEGRGKEVNYTPASPRKGAYTGFSSEVMF